MSRRLPHITALLTALALCPSASASSVYMYGARHHALLPPDEPKPERAPGPRVTDRDVVIEPVEDGLRIKVRWRLDSDRPGWFAGTLIGPEYHIESLELGDGLSAHGNGGGRYLYGWIEGPTEVEMTATLDGWQEGVPLDLTLMKSPKGAVVLDSDDFELEVGAAAAAEVDDVWWTGAPSLSLSFERPTESIRRNQTALLTAQSGVGLTVLDNELIGKARLSWQVLRGQVATVAFSAAGLGADLEVSGSNVRAFRREGGRIVVELNEASEGRIDVEARWTQVLPDGAEASIPAATLRPDAFRVEQSLQIARGGDREVLPRISGVQPQAASELPVWGQGLIEGTPTAAFTGQGSGSLSLLRFEPVSGPPVVVDAAQYTIATSAEGRVLMRALYEVRNERAQWLDVRPPEGMEILGARVGADTAFPIEGEAGTWRIPLLRSVETVEGLLTFPVEVALIGEVGEWSKKEEREVELPVLNADVAVSRVTLYLPPGYGSQLEDNEADQVPAFSEGKGLAYGFAVGDTGAAQADALFQEAVSSWMDNDFGEAQAALDDLRAMGGDNENVRRLQSNLDLVSGNYRGDADATSTRRIREQARARSLEEERKAKDLKRKAEQAQVAGDYGGSSSYYSEYIELTEKLQQLEQEESVEYKAAEQDARRNLATNAQLEDNWRTASTASKSERKKGEESKTKSFQFEDMEVTGEFTTPDGSYGSGAGYGDAGQTVTIDANQIIITDATSRDFTTEIAPADDGIAAIFDESVDPLAESAGELANRDLLGDALYGGEEGGVAGGVVGGVVGGVLHGAAGAAAPEPTPEPEYEATTGSVMVQEDIQRAPVRDVMDTPAMAPTSMGSRGRGRGGGGSGGGLLGGLGGGKDKASKGRGKAAAPSAPPPPPPKASPGPERADYDGDDAGMDYDEVELEEVDEEVAIRESRTGRSEADAIGLLKRKGGRVGGISLGKKKADMPPEEVYEPDTIEIFAEEPDAPEVTATSLSIVVPNLGGETVLYQKLLLTAGEAPTVLVRAKEHKDRRSK